MFTHKKTLQRLQGPLEILPGTGCDFFAAPFLVELRFSSGMYVRQAKYKIGLANVPDEDHDYCLHCGADNGRGGAFRVGFDCCHCGSN